MRKLTALLLVLALLLAGCNVTELPAEKTADSDFSVHFIDVGQADCALLECGGEYALIDGGNVEDSSLVVSYLEKEGVEELNAVICTHAHEDHVGGLAGVLAVYPTQAVYSPTRTHSSKCFDKFMYYADQQGLEVTIPKPGDTIALGDATMTVLGPLKSYADTNNTSIVIRAQYGDTRFLFTGDMETLAESDLLEAGTDVSADVLKVGHHGSSTSTGYQFLYEVNPTYGVISCGTGNSYGHPHDEPMSRLRDAGVTLFRTDKMGTIVAVSDGSEISFNWENANVQPTLGDGVGFAAEYFIGNRNTNKFHLPTCSSLPAEKNRIILDSYQEALVQGFVPCPYCVGKQ